jgi:hypothetical protein
VPNLTAIIGGTILGTLAGPVWWHVILTSVGGTLTSWCIATLVRDFLKERPRG